MKEKEFRKWLHDNNTSKKMCSDFISRLKKLEKELDNIDLDEQYKNDQCKSILSLFDNKGLNKEMDAINPPSLPLGKYYLSTYKYALKKYISFKISNHILFSDNKEHHTR